MFGMNSITDGPDARPYHRLSARRYRRRALYSIGTTPVSRLRPTLGNVSRRTPSCISSSSPQRHRRSGWSPRRSAWDSVAASASFGGSVADRGGLTLSAGRRAASRSRRRGPPSSRRDASGPDAPAERDTAPEASAPLFRPEALRGHRVPRLGTVLLARPISHSVFAGFALASILAVAALVGFGEFTRKARVSGWVVPQQGVVRVFVPQPSVVSELLVREGAEVKKDQPLLNLSADRQTTAYGATQAEVSRLLTTRRTSLQSEQRQQQQLFEQ